MDEWADAILIYLSRVMPFPAVRQALYFQEVIMAMVVPSSDKLASLQQFRACHPHPELIRHPLFLHHPFFDPYDLVQVRYEMVRQVEVERASPSQVVRDFGCSRTTWYALHASFQSAGLAGLLPLRPGPHGGSKVTAEVLALLDDTRRLFPAHTPGSLATSLATEYGIRVHPRTIRRALNLLGNLRSS